MVWFADIVIFSSSNKVWKVVGTSKHPVQSVIYLSISCRPGCHSVTVKQRKRLVWSKEDNKVLL